MKILLTNDDGIQAKGIKAIYHALIAAKHTVTVVAPMRQQSAVGQSLTVFEPVRVSHYQEDNYQGIGIYGTPTDCVKLALGTLLTEPIDLVISGINLGANVGPDVLYSGTVSAATEACMSGFKALALSVDDHYAQNLESQAAHATELLAKIDWSKITDRRVININYPKGEFSQNKGLKLCLPAKAMWENHYEERRDPRGNSYYWLDGEINSETVPHGSDRELLTLGYITLTPLHFDFSDHLGISLLENMGFA